MAFLTRHTQILITILLVISYSFVLIAQSEFDPSSAIPNYDISKDKITFEWINNSAKTNAHFSQINSNPHYLGSSLCWIEPDDSFTSIPKNDDGSFGPIQLPFTFDLYGSQYDQVWINTNGNLSFNGPYTPFTATGFPIDATLIAPFWADVDTRQCGTIYYKISEQHLIVTWHEVGFYNQQCDLTNSFQAIIGTYNDPLTGIGFNVNFNYDNMEWTTGNASRGTHGFGGIPATVGINAGDNLNFIQLGRFGTPEYTYDGPAGSVDGVYFLNNQCFKFNVERPGNQPPAVFGLPPNNTIDLKCGETATLNLTFTGPELNQLITSTIEQSICGLESIIVDGLVSNVSLQIEGSACNIGQHQITITAVDNGEPASETTIALTINITEYLPEHLICKDTIVLLSTNDLMVLDAHELMLNSDDFCGNFLLTPASILLSCDEKGLQTISLQMHDRLGNYLSCNSRINVETTDDLNPCPETDECAGVDSDCDGIADSCDRCPGGDDSIDHNGDGIPDCVVFPGREYVDSSWLCGNNSDKVLMCRSNDKNNAYSQTVCVDIQAVQSLLHSGSFLGPCYQSRCSEQPYQADGSETIAEQSSSSLLVFPNPSSGTVNILINDTDTPEPGTLQVFDPLGRLIYRLENTRSSHTITLDLNLQNAMMNGIYVLHYSNSLSTSTSKVLIIR